MRFFLALASFTILVQAFPSPIASGANKNGTLDDLVKRQLFGSQVSCGPVAVIYCKGTFEPLSYGIVVGNQFTAGLQAVLPRGTQFHSVDYSNGVVGYLTGGALDGISTMKSLAESYSSKCPGIKLVMSGYSQGAQVTHKASASVNSQTKEAIKAVVLFGDPMYGSSIPGIAKDKIYTNCAIGDGICTGLPLITISHLAYAVDFTGAIAFIQKKIGSSGGGGGAPAAPEVKGAKSGKGGKDQAPKDSAPKGGKDSTSKGGKDSTSKGGKSM